jgi:hypothetical protein
MFLAQVPRQDTFGDIFGGLLEQIPFFLILQICLAATLLMAAIGYFVYRRRKRAEAAKAAAPPPPGFVPAPESEISVPAASADYDMGDLPDLDLLVDSSSLVIDTLAPKRAKPGVVAVNLHTGASVEAKEILAILRDENDGRLIVQIGDTAYRTLVDTPNAKKQFAEIMKELAEVVAQPDSQALEASPTVEPEIEPELPQEPQAAEENQPSLRDLVEPQPAAPAPPPVKKSAPPPPIRPDGAMPGDLASYKLENYPVDIKRGGILRPKKFESAPVPELNIAAAIEAYLQYKLQHTPEYSGRSIHVHPAPGGGVAIEVDGAFFDAVGDVNDLEVRQFLADTIQEWQERQ